jgi:Cu+-exporting ATPase
MTGYDADGVIRIAGSVEKASEHPLAKAIMDEAAIRKVKLSDAYGFEAMSGNGVKAELDGRSVMLGNRRLFAGSRELQSVEQKVDELEGRGLTVMILSVAGSIAGLIAVADTLKPSAKAAISALKKLKVSVVLLTGDNARVAASVSKEIGIVRYFADVLPQQKEEIIESLQKEGRVVAMVGDGINDAPALAKADVGIAIGSGTDIAKETGGIVLIREDLRDVATAIGLSRSTLAKIRQNLFWAFAYNVILIPIAAGALVPFFGLGVYDTLPFLAAAAMAVSSVTVVTNSLTLFRFKPQGA